MVWNCADGVVKDGGNSGNGKKKVAWGAGVNREGGMRMMEDLRMILSFWPGCLGG